MLIRLWRRCVNNGNPGSPPSDPEINRDICILCFCFLKVLAVGIGIAAQFFWPARGGALVGWSVVLSVNFGMGCCLYGLQFWQMLLLWASTWVPCTLLFAVLFIGGRVESVHPTIIIITGMGVTSLIVSRLICASKRRQWQRLAMCKAELERLHDILHDLLPKYYVRKLITSVEHIPCLPCHIIVLQFDLAGFTGLAATMEPTVLAADMHALFSAFDNAITVRDLFKIDTIGDAYIVVAFLKDVGGDDAEQVSCHSRTCEKVLAAAADMLLALRMPSGASASMLHGRIGIAVGSAVAGVLQGLQPRYCVMGPVMQEVATLEQGAPMDAIRCSLDFLRLLDPGYDDGAPPRAMPARLGVAAPNARGQTKSPPSPGGCSACTKEGGGCCVKREGNGCHEVGAMPGQEGYLRAHGWSVAPCRTAVGHAAECGRAPEGLEREGARAVGGGGGGEGEVLFAINGGGGGEASFGDAERSKLVYDLSMSEAVLPKGADKMTEAESPQHLDVSSSEDLGKSGARGCFKCFRGC